MLGVLTIDGLTASKGRRTARNVRLTLSEANFTFETMGYEPRARSSVACLVWLVWIAVGLAPAACQPGSTTPRPTRGVGDRLKPFISVESQTGRRYCQVCAFGGRPTLMAIFDLNDPDFDADLATFQALVTQHPELTAFALFGRLDDGRFEPPSDPESALVLLRRHAARLKVDFPLTTLPTELTPGEALHYRPFREQFDVFESRTVLLAAADNRIRFAERLTTPDSRRRLQRAVEALF